MRIYFLRHGRADRSSWHGINDYERPLTLDGKERMARQAEFMAEMDLGLDVILSSPLTRALQTAEIVAERLNLLDRCFEDELLEPGMGPADLATSLEKYPHADAIMLVGHEPDFSRTIGYLIGDGEVVCKKGSLARVDLVDAGELSGVLVYLIPPKVMLI
jgi:phosphohistidine phosphatase